MQALLGLVRPPRHSHRAPDPNCSCGLYALYDAGGGRRRVNVSADRCLGAVRCWGRLVLHPEGFRAEFASILGLYMPTSLSGWDDPEPIRSIAEVYAVPIFRELGGLRAFAMEFGANYAPTGEGDPPWRPAA